MATNHTANYNLNQWVATDPVLRTDFNEDNSKLDTALKSLNTTVQQHTTQLTQQAAAIAKCGNCKLYYTSYTGDGQSSRSISFPGKPKFVLVLGTIPSQMFFVIEGADSTWLEGYGALVEWSGSTLILSSSSGHSNPGFNYKDSPSYVVALIPMDE